MTRLQSTQKAHLFAILLLGLACPLNATNVDTQSQQVGEEMSELTEQVIDHFGITNPDKLSSATKRALKWPKLGNEWYIQFQVDDLKGDLAYEEGVVRRDPSGVLKEDGKYYVWYSRSVGPSEGFGGDVQNSKVWPWDRCDIWYATSADGWTWQEKGIAVPRGKKGNYDDRSVFTVEIMKHDGMYYLCYQTVKSPYTVWRVKNQVGLAWASSPDGPWRKATQPILSPADNGIWKGKEQNRFNVVKKGDFDSHKVHDPCILPYDGRFYLYYKGEQMGEEITFGGRDRHGVAIADDPKGLYVKSPYSPISNSGHEVVVWPYQGGIASLITTDGPERNTLQWAPDGINFEIKAYIRSAPHAIGLNRSADTEKEPTAIMRWGLTHEYMNSDYQYIRRFSSHRVTHHTAKGEQPGD